MCNACVSEAISGVCLFCLCDISERQLHNKNARGINIQLHAQQLHINNCWGANCVILPAPMVLSRIGAVSKALNRALTWQEGGQFCQEDRRFKGQGPALQKYIRHKNISYLKKFDSNYFLITVTRFEIFRINFRNLPDTYCIRVSCVTLPAWDPSPC